MKNSIANFVRKIFTNDAIYYIIFIIIFPLVVTSAIFYGPWSSGPWRDIVANIPISEIESPNKDFKIEIEDVRTEGQLLTTVIITYARFRRVAPGGSVVEVIAADTDGDPLLRPRVVWTEPGRVCLVTPEIRNMTVRSGMSEGVRIDVRRVDWIGHGPIPSFNAVEICR